MFEGETRKRYGTRQLLARVKRSRHSTLDRIPQKLINDLNSEADILKEHPNLGVSVLKKRRTTEEENERR